MRRLLVLSTAVLLTTTSRTAAIEQVNMEDAAIGLVVGNIPDSPPESWGLEKWPTKDGAVIVRVDPHASAHKAGLKLYTIIDVINAKKTPNAAAAEAELKKVKAGDTVRIHAFVPVKTGSRVKYIGKSGRIKAASWLETIKPQLEKETDDITGVSLIRHKEAPSVSGQSDVSLRIMTIDGAAVPSLQICYVAEDWLFVKSYTFVIDGDNYDLPVAGDVQRDNSGGRVWEWSTHEADPAKKNDRVTELIDKLAHAGIVKIRYVGNQYVKDREVGDDEMGRIRAVWYAFIAKPAKEADE